MNEFKTYHPIVNFIYFLAVICFSVFYMHPICLAISLIGSFTHLALLEGGKVLKTTLCFMLPLLIISSLINPAFNHEGITILSYLPSGNPLTLESIVYGFCSACMIIALIYRFACFNHIMTSDKIIYLFGRIIPSLSLVFSMILSFIPKFKKQFRQVADAQKYLTGTAQGKSIPQRAKDGIKILSVMITWSFENAIDTADSMKSRGYGLYGRTSFSNFRFTLRDTVVLVLTILLSLITLLGSAFGQTYFSYYPSMDGADLSMRNIGVFTAYLLLSLLPVILEIWEAVKWKSLKSKI